MNSAYAPNSQPNVPTRVCQGRVVTTDLPTLGTNPNTKQHRSATQEAKNLGDLHSLGQTVRVGGGDCPRGHADCPQAQGRPSENGTQTSSTAPQKTDHPSSTCGPSVLRGLSGLSLRTVCQTLCNQKHTTERIKKANKNT
jgi:hypothetical protein